MNILIVDDSRTMRMVVRKTLRQTNLGAFNIEEACNGMDAIEKLKSWKADVILSDWNMPEMDGLALLGAVRGTGNIGVKFGFITSQATPHSHLLAQNAGATFMVSKPVSAEELESVLRPLM